MAVRLRSLKGRIADRGELKLELVLGHGTGYFLSPTTLPGPLLFTMRKCNATSSTSLVVDALSLDEARVLVTASATFRGAPVFGTDVELGGEGSLAF